ncbi:OpgC domain-containing protein, partial [Sphingomonas endophytica]|uniref:OpgC domain-containing protein n=1 Tax=Sphingomonas endophytica TaxID=869719 RepID=UPI003D15B661
MTTVWYKRSLQKIVTQSCRSCSSVTRRRPAAGRAGTGDGSEPMDVKAVLPPRGRDYRLDVLRGFANWAIYLDHIPN